MTVTKEQKNEALAQHRQECNLHSCWWDSDINGDPYVQHAPACTAVIMHVQNKREAPPLTPESTQDVVDRDTAVSKAIEKMRTGNYQIMSRDQMHRCRDLFIAKQVLLADKKNADYAGSDDPFFNLRRGGLLGVVIRMDDKVSRLLNLLKSGVDPQILDESIEDTFGDFFNYSWLGMCMKAEIDANKPQS